jgi:hypothetical protein
MANDTVPTSAAAMASERRDMPGRNWPNTVIKGLFRTTILARLFGRAGYSFGFPTPLSENDQPHIARGLTIGGGWGGGRLTADYAQFAASQQTNL